MQIFELGHVLGIEACFGSTSLKKFSQPQFLLYVKTNNTIVEVIYSAFQRYIVLWGTDDHKFRKNLGMR